MLGASVVAIDPGSTATRIVWLKGSPGSLEVAGAERYVVGAANTSLSAIIADLRSKKMPPKAIILGAPGHTATLRYNLLPPVPDWRLEMIRKYETEEMVEKSGEPLSSAFLQLDVPESQADDRILLVGLGKEQLIQPQIEEIEQAGGRVAMVVPQALALYHAYRQGTTAVPAETVLLADVGAEETHIAISIDGRLIFARSVNFGGAQFDEGIASALGVRDDQARKLKEGLEQGKVPEELIHGTRGAMRTAMGQLVRVLESSLSFCRLQTKIPEIQLDRVLVGGGTAKVPGLIEYLDVALSGRVERFVPKVSGQLPGDPSDWVVAVGLAATAFDREQNALDLLPAPAKAKREFRERTLFMYFSGAGLVVTLLMLFVVAFLQNMSTQDDWDTLASQEVVLNGFKQRQEQSEQDNRQYRSQIDRIKKELDTTTFQARVFDTLRREIPEAVSVERVSLARQEDEGDVRIEITVQGRSDNSERKAIAHVENLRMVLGRVPGVVRASVELGDLEEDGTYPFELIVAPQAKVDPKKKKPRRPTGPRRRG